MNLQIRIQGGLVYVAGRLIEPAEARRLAERLANEADGASADGRLVVPQSLGLPWRDVLTREEAYQLAADLFAAACQIGLEWSEPAAVKLAAV